MRKDDAEYYESKRQEVLEKLKPIADAIGIKLDYVLDWENNREYLACNDQNICTNSTSVYGIEKEFWGYVFILKYTDEFGKIATRTKNVIRKYWYDKDFKQPYKGW